MFPELVLGELRKIKIEKKYGFCSAQIRIFLSEFSMNFKRMQEIFIWIIKK